LAGGKSERALIFLAHSSLRTRLASAGSSFAAQANLQFLYILLYAPLQQNATPTRVARCARGRITSNCRDPGLDDCVAQGVPQWLSQRVPRYRATRGQAQAWLPD
jgi:hypothetical protein